MEHCFSEIDYIASETVFLGFRKSHEHPCG